MCIPIQERSKKERVLFGIANLALSLGLALPYVVHASGAVSKDWMDGARGLLIGVSIPLNLMLAWSRRRCRETPAGGL
jgi:hypothetical protein